MTRTELELVTVLVLLYANDCIYWLGPNDLAFSRSSSKVWKSHQLGPLNITFLGRAPLLIDPFLLRPGFVRIKDSHVSAPATPARALRKLGKRLNRLWLVELLGRVQAILLLLLLPWIIWTHRLTLLWLPFVSTLLLSHVLLMVFAIIALRQSSITRPLSIAAPLLLNPLGAIRILDIFSQSYFNQLEAQRYTKDADTSTK